MVVSSSPRLPFFTQPVVSSNPRAPEGQSGWRISVLAAYKAHGFSPKLIFHLFSLRHTLCQFPSASFKLSLLSLSLPLRFFLSLPLLPPSLFFSHLLSLFSVPRGHLPTPTKPHASPPSLSVYVLSLFLLTSSSVVWLTEKCLICRAFLLDSSWSKMSATPPGAIGMWYSTMLECWSCVLVKNAQWGGVNILNMLSDYPK